jgi:hypothetical protein
MIIYGKLEATFTARSTGISKQNTKKHKRTNGESFQIAELNNIKDSEVREITTEEDVIFSRSYATYKLIGNATINRTTIRVNTILNSIELHDFDWNNMALFNTRIINVHKVSRGYYLKSLKNASLFDGFAALILNVFILYPASLFSSKVTPLSDELYVGHLESEFKGSSINGIAAATEISNTTVADNSVANETDTIIDNVTINDDVPPVDSNTNDPLTEQEMNELRRQLNDSRSQGIDTIRYNKE